MVQPPADCNRRGGPRIRAFEPSWVPVPYHMYGNSLLCPNSTKRNSALYDACMMAAALVEPVAWRIQPKDAPASAIGTTRRHELPYSWKCNSPNGIEAARTPA